MIHKFCSLCLINNDIYRLSECKSIKQIQRRRLTQVGCVHQDLRSNNFKVESGWKGTHNRNKPQCRAERTQTYSEPNTGSSHHQHNKYGGEQVNAHSWAAQAGRRNTASMHANTESLTDKVQAHTSLKLNAGQDMVKRPRRGTGYARGTRYTRGQESPN